MNRLNYELVVGANPWKKIRSDNMASFNPLSSSYEYDAKKVKFADLNENRWLQFTDETVIC